MIALVGCSADAEEGTDRPPAGPAAGVAFEPLPGGWHLWTAAVRRERGCPVQSESIVTSWTPDRSNPGGPAGDMPHGGTMVSANVIRMHPDARVRADHPRLGRLPLALPKHASGRLEGYDDIPEYRIFRSGRRFVLEVRVAIAERHPRAGMLARAQKVVDRLRLPEWIRHTCP